MISIQHLIDNEELYAEELEKRHKDFTLVNSLKHAFLMMKEKQFELDELRRQKNEFNKIIGNLYPEERNKKLEEMKLIANKIDNLEEQIADIKQSFDETIHSMPNLSSAETPAGKDSDSNKEIGIFGNKPAFTFIPKPYYELPVFRRDYLGEKGTEAVGYRGYYIKGKLAQLQRALFNWALDEITKDGFEYVIPPIMVNEEVLYGTGFFPTGRDDIYEVLEGDKSKFLVGSSEPSLMFIDSNSTLDLSSPRLLTAWTTCFRKEAGAHGKDTKGGIRVHQFEKVEMVAICKIEDSPKIFNRLTSRFNSLMDQLGLFYHHLEVSGGDMSLKNHRQIDIEAWFPASQDFREVCSSSNCTDYQTRNLNIKYKKDDGKIEIAHSLNCTGMTNRTMFAIMEQCQQEDGSIKIPQVLLERLGFDILK